MHHIVNMAEDTHPLIDMRQLYGTTELSLWERFETGSKATQFLQDYCLNAVSYTHLTLPTITAV